MVHADVTSANTVGYQLIDVCQNFSLFTVTFKNISTETYDLLDIIPCDASGNPFTGGTSMGKILVQKMDDTGKYLGAYNYLSVMGKWANGMAPLTPGAVTLKAGESICINNGQGAAIKFRVSGEVSLTPQTYTLPPNFSLVGNMTPVAVDLLDVQLCDASGNPFTGGTSMGKVLVQKMDADGKYLGAYNYLSVMGKWANGMAPLTPGAVMLQPGESFCVNNGQGAPVILKFPNPIK